MRLGKLFHIIHMTGDLPALEAWYDDVFAVQRGFLDHNYMEGEKRDASLVVLGDSVIEPLAPAFRVAGWDEMPLGRFFQRFGNHWHSIAWYCDDVAAVWNRCRELGIRTYVTGGAPAEEPPSGAFMTHPNDTHAQLEFMESSPTLADPRLQPGFDADRWVEGHPLGLEGLAYTTVVVRDLDRAISTYVDGLRGQLLHQSESRLTGTRNAYVAMGEVVVELAEPVVDGTFAANDLSKNNEIHHAAAFKVRDLEVAQQYLESKDVRLAGRDADSFICDPATTHGAYFRFTAADIPGA